MAYKGIRVQVFLVHALSLEEFGSFKAVLGLLIEYIGSYCLITYSCSKDLMHASNSLFPSFSSLPCLMLRNRF